MNDEDRYRDLLQLFGELKIEFQRFEQQARKEQLEYWKATAAAIRGLTDWWVKTADDERKERDQRRRELDDQLGKLDNRMTKQDQELKAQSDVLTTINHRGRRRQWVEVAILAGIVLVFGVLIWVSW